MSELFDPPRWPGGPHICIKENLPAFATKELLFKELERFSPGVHIDRIGKCSVCGEWHAATTAREPGGNSSGSGRYNKHKDSMGVNPIGLTPLNPADMLVAKREGTAQFNRRKNTPHKWKRGKGERKDTLEGRISSVGAEIFAARALGVEWIPSDLPDHEGDIGAGRQVRSTDWDDGRLLIHDPHEDEDDHVFFLVIGWFPNYRMAGWLSGRDARKGRKKVELVPGRPCYAIPQEELRPIEEYKVQQ